MVEEIDSSQNSTQNISPPVVPQYHANWVVSGPHFLLRHRNTIPMPTRLDNIWSSLFFVYPQKIKKKGKGTCPAEAMLSRLNVSCFI